MKCQRSIFKNLFMVTIMGLALLLMGGMSAYAFPVQGGLTGQYYDGADFSTPTFTNFKYDQIDPTVNFNWSNDGSPDSTDLGNDYFSIRWTGWVNAPTAGTYFFSTYSDDGSMLSIDGVSVVDNGGNHAPTSSFGSTDLTKGLHSLELTYHEYGGYANVALLWNYISSGVSLANNTNYSATTTYNNSNYFVIGSDYLYYDNGNSPDPVPEPSTILLLGGGLLGLGWYGRKRKKA